MSVDGPDRADPGANRADKGIEQPRAVEAPANLSAADRLPTSVATPSVEQNNRDAVHAGFTDGNVLLSQIGLQPDANRGKADGFLKAVPGGKDSVRPTGDSAKAEGIQPDQARSHKDGSTYTQVKLADGSGSIDHIGTGPTPGDNYTVRQSGNNYEVLDRDNKPAERSMDPAVSRERERLETLAGNFEDPEQRTRFVADMAKLENRMAGKPQEVAKTFSEVAGMLENKDNNKIGSQRTEQLARDVMSQAATPDIVDQGLHPTCSVSAVESVVYSDNPSIAAKAMRDIAETGEHQMTNGLTVKLDDQALKPDAPADPTKRLDNERSLATKYMNFLMIDAVNEQGLSPWMKEHDWSFRYKENEKDGSQLKLSVPGQEPTMSEFTGLSSEAQVSAYRMLTGTQGKDILVIEHESMAAKDKDGNLKKEDGVATYANQQEFDQLVGELKKSQGFPVVTTIDARNDNFRAGACKPASSQIIDGSGSAPHALVLDDLKGDAASLNNQWGSKCDYDLPKEEVYKASLRSELNLTQRIQDAEAAGKPDLGLEMDAKNRELSAKLSANADPTSHRTQPLPEAYQFLTQEIGKAEQYLSKTGENIVTDKAEKYFYGMALGGMLSQEDLGKLVTQMKQSPVFKDRQPFVQKLEAFL